MKKFNVKTLQKYIVFFYVYAFLGWIVDTSICLVMDGELTKRGFLYGPICPMYGYAAIVLIMLSKKITGKGGFIRKVVIATIWCSVLEYVTAFILDVFFHQKWWDYQYQPFNLHGRICLAASILWGILSVLFMTVLHPRVERLLKKIAEKLKPKAINAIICSVVIVNFVDTVLSIIRYLK